MKKITVTAILLCIFTCFVFGTAEAQSSIETGFFVLKRADNFSTESDERISGLQNDADTESSILPLVLFDLNAPYGGRNTIYFKTDMGQGEAFGLSLGTVIPLAEDENILDLSVSVSPFREVWKNPYLTGAERSETDTTSYGAKAALRNVLGSPLGTSFSITTIEVDDDEIGRLYSSLARDGNIYLCSADYQLTLTPELYLVPALSIGRGDFDGGSNSYDRYGASLRLIYRMRPFSLMQLAAYSKQKYDETHPLFGKKRDDDRYALVFSAQYSGLFGAENIYLKILAGYGRTDSNITFCDSESSFIGSTVGFRF
jgi:hypothetical protein